MTPPMSNKDLSLQESLLLEMMREWSGKDNCRMKIEYRDGAWEITMSISLYGNDHTARGVGASFAQAWDNMNPTWV
jgi:hypothetical protein